MGKEGRGTMKIKRDIEAFEKSGEFLFISFGLNCCECSVSSLNMELELERKVGTRNTDVGSS